MSMIISGTDGLTFNNSTTQASAGSVLQVVQGLTSTSVSQTVSTYISTTLSASITPKFSTSKILVIVNQNGVRKTGNSDIGIKLQRNSTDITSFTFYGLYTGTTLEFRSGSFSTCYLDSPATTSSVTYSTSFSNNEAVGTVTVQNEGAGSTSTITLMEIAG